MRLSTTEIFNIAIFIQFDPDSLNLFFIFIQFNPRLFNSIPMVILFHTYSFNSIFRSIEFNFCISLIQFQYWFNLISVFIQFNFHIHSIQSVFIHSIFALIDSIWGLGRFCELMGHWDFPRFETSIFVASEGFCRVFLYTSFA